MRAMQGWAGAAVCLWGTAALGQGRPVQFGGVGELSGPTTSVVQYQACLSDDGQTIVGRSSSSAGAQAFMWRPATGMVGLGRFSNGIQPASYGNGVSRDGQVATGYSQSGTAWLMFTWTSGGGMVGHGDPAGGIAGSAGACANWDGSMVYGSGRVATGMALSDTTAQLWSAATGWVEVYGSDPYKGYKNHTVLGCSRDGTVAVGRAMYEHISTATYFRAFRWNYMSEPEVLPALSGGLATTQAFGVSADGAVIVGSSTTTSGLQAFRWTRDDGIEALGYFEGEPEWSHAFGVSPDGSVIVGVAKRSRFPSDIGEPFIWTRKYGLRPLIQVLTNEYGLDLSGWRLESACAVTTGVDGGGPTVIVGNGQHTVGGIERSEVWYAVIGSPCPADHDGSGFVDHDDFDAFVADFVDGNDAADFDLSGFVDRDDFDGFVRAFEAGC